MSGKVKMKCARCGKHFKSAQRQNLCESCTTIERQARAASKQASAKPIQSVTAPAPPKIVGPGAAILVPGLVPPPAAYTSAPMPPEIDTRAGDHQQGTAPTQDHAQNAKPAKPPKGPRPAKGARITQRVHEPRVPRPPRVPPFQLTDELRTRIETRYLELAQPIEFDGIRAQIAGELSIPKFAVKRAVHELRTRLHMPSWWDLQAYTGSAEDLERIRAAYEPLLPIPEVGIHKQIATDLGLDPVVAYRGIQRIRAEMRLPQYNPPEAHTTPTATATAATATSSVPATAP